MTSAMDRDADRKGWTDIVARAALRGWALWRSDAADGPVRYFLGRFGLIRCCADLNDVESVIGEHIGNG